MSTTLSTGRERSSVDVVRTADMRLRALDDRLLGRQPRLNPKARYLGAAAVVLLANLRLVFALASVDTATFMLLGYILVIIPTVFVVLRRRNLQREADRY